MEDKIINLLTLSSYNFISNSWLWINKDIIELNKEELLKNIRKIFNKSFSDFNDRISYITDYLKKNALNVITYFNEKYIKPKDKLPLNYHYPYLIYKGDINLAIDENVKKVFLKKRYSEYKKGEINFSNFNAVITYLIDRELKEILSEFKLKLILVRYGEVPNADLVIMYPGFKKIKFTTNELEFELTKIIFTIPSIRIPESDINYEKFWK